MTSFHTNCTLSSPRMSFRELCILITKNVYRFLDKRIFQKVDEALRTTHIWSFYTCDAYYERSFFSLRSCHYFSKIKTKSLVRAKGSLEKFENSDQKIIFLAREKNLWEETCSISCSFVCAFDWIEKLSKISQSPIESPIIFNLILSLNFEIYP